MTPVALATADVTTPSPPSGVLARELQGAGVGRFQDGRWQPLPAGALEGKRHFAFYYSAHWCPPCRAFTPKLVAFYQSFTASHPDFELVFVSSDHSEAEMRKYMQEAGMPWPAVPFAKAQTAHLPRSTGNGIPCLVLADAEGRVLADSYAGATYLGPGKVLTDIGKLPVGGAGAPAPLLAAVNNPPKPAATAPEKSSDGLRREMAAAATAERRGAYDKHRAEADALYNDLNVRRAKLKGADAAAVAAFNADAARYAALLEQTKVELGALGPVTPTLTAAESVVPSSQSGGPKFTGPTSPDAKRGPVYVPGVVGGNPNGTKPTTSTTPGENPGLYRRSLDKARAARDAAVSNGAEALR